MQIKRIIKEVKDLLGAAKSKCNKNCFISFASATRILVLSCLFRSRGILRNFLVSHTLNSLTYMLKVLQTY